MSNRTMSILKEILFAAFIITLLTFLHISGYAQTGDDKGMKAEQVDVVKPYEPTISNAIKMNDNPLTKDSIPPLPKINYPLLGRQFPTEFKVEPISSATMKGEPLVKLYRHYFKAGFGNYNTPYGEYYFNALRSKKYSYGVNLKHFSSAGSIDKKFYPGISDNLVSANGKYFLKNHIALADANYTRNVVHFYGIKSGADTVTTIGKTDILQRYANMGFNGQFASGYVDSNKLNYDTRIRYYSYFDSYNAAESNVYLTADIGKYVNTEWIGGNVGVDYYNNTNSRIKSNNATIVNVSPRAKLEKSDFLLNVGVNAVVDDDRNTYFHFYPHADLKYAAVQRFLYLHAGVTGNVLRNSFKQLTTTNPFLVSTVQLMNTYKFETFGGAYGALGNRMNYTVGANYAWVQNLPLYVNYRANILQNKFGVIYDTVKVLTLNGELGYQMAERIRVNAKVNYFNYDLKNQMAAWQLPNIDATLGAHYNLKDKIIVGLDFYYMGKRYGQAFVTDSLGAVAVEKVKLKGIADVNLFTEYRYTKNISAFVRFNNMAAMRYNRWNNYPMQRFSFLLGFTYTF